MRHRRSDQPMLVPAEALVRGAHTLTEQPVVPELFAPKTVTRLSALADPRDGVQSVSLATYNRKTNEEVVLPEPVKDNAAAAVKPFEVAHGSLSGTLSGVRDARGKTVRVTV